MGEISAHTDTNSSPMINKLNDEFNENEFNDSCDTTNMYSTEKAFCLSGRVFSSRRPSYNTLIGEIHRDCWSTSLDTSTSFGLLGLAIALFAFSISNISIDKLDSSFTSDLLPMIFVNSGIVQLVTGFCGFQSRNILSVTAFFSYGVFWIAFGTYIYFLVPNIQYLGKNHEITGIFLLVWLFITLPVTLAAYSKSRILFSIFAAVNVIFSLVILGNFDGNANLVHISGWCGLITALTISYISIINLRHTNTQPSRPSFAMEYSL